jgi:HEAT repeat protein
MKATLLNKVEKSYFVLAAILFVLLLSETFGQNQKVSDLTKSKYALENLNSAIQSKNDGVRESAIYLAGEYRFIETEDALIKQLKVEKKADIKILIGLALFRMDSEKGMNEMQNLAVSDSDSRVRKMSYAIYNEFLVNNTASKTAER